GMVGVRRRGVVVMLVIGGALAACGSSSRPAAAPIATSPPTARPMTTTTTTITRRVAGIVASGAQLRAADLPGFTATTQPSAGGFPGVVPFTIAACMVAYAEPHLASVVSPTFARGAVNVTARVVVDATPATIDAAWQAYSATWLGHCLQ